MLYFNSLGDRPAVRTGQVLDPRSIRQSIPAVSRSFHNGSGLKFGQVQRLMCKPITQLRLKYVSTTDLTPGPSSYLRAFTSRQRDQGSRWIQRKSELSSTLNRTVIIKAHVQEPERTTTRGSAIYIS